MLHYLGILHDLLKPCEDLAFSQKLGYLHVAFSRVDVGVGGGVCGCLKRHIEQESGMWQEVPIVTIAQCLFVE